MEEVDCLIIGAGVVGLAVVNSLAKDVQSVLVIERHDSFGRETSSRNSEVIHDKFLPYLAVLAQERGVMITYSSEFLQATKVKYA